MEVTRTSSVSRTGWMEAPCLRCGGETMINGLCPKCDAELNRIVTGELRRYASEEEIREWCVMHYIEEE